MLKRLFFNRNDFKTLITEAKLDYQNNPFCSSAMVQCLVNFCSKNTLYRFHLTNKDIVKVILLGSL